MTKEEVLQQCTVEGNVVKLPNTQLDRNEYLEVKKALELIGGKWKGGKVFGFVFATDPTDLLEEIANGEKRNLKKEFQFFATPEKLADELVYLADLKQYDTILEPSAGQGAIVKAINKVCDVVPDCFALMEVNTIILNKSGLRFNLIGDDFFNHNGKTYSKIIANPPFSKSQDVKHILHMYELLNEWGRLVSIASSSIKTREWKLYDELRALNPKFIELPEWSFKESWTLVNAVIVVINK